MHKYLELTHVMISIFNYWKFKLSFTNSSLYISINKYIQHKHDVGVVLKLPRKTLQNAAKWFEQSTAQLYQDIFVLSEVDFKKEGYFVEFGATNGHDLSNTHLLETQFNWQGIIAEPAKSWHQDLKSNRNCHIETDCVWIETGKSLLFNAVDEGELSTLEQFTKSDHFSKKRKQGEIYPVTTISLNDLLKKYNAPKEIDYLSVDTEGSEYEILSHFDFNSYNIKVITVEHNYTETRAKVHKLLTQHGYVRKYQGFSKWDDWYLKIN